MSRTGPHSPPCPEVSHTGLVITLAASSFFFLSPFPFLAGKGLSTGVGTTGQERIYNKFQPSAEQRRLVTGALPVLSFLERLGEAGM